MNWKIAGTVLVKELRETLRDRRSLVIIIIIPAFLYPALFVLTQQLALFGKRSMETAAVRVAVVGATPAAFPLRSDSDIVVVDGGDAPMQKLRDGELAAVIVFEGADRSRFETDSLRIVYDASRDQSNFARGLVQQKVRRWGDSLLVQRLETQGLPRSFGYPLVVTDTSVATPQRLGGYALGRFLPMILILMTILGAFYPAIDLAAGEKERGTLEPLLTVPVKADEIVAGKFAAVTIIALVAATLNLGSMLLTFQSGLYKVHEGTSQAALPTLFYNLLHGTLRHQAPARQNADTVRQQLHLIHLVRGKQHCPSPHARSVHKCVDRPAAQYVQPDCGLVQDQRRRIVQHRPRDRDPLALPGRQSSAKPVLKVFNLEQFDVIVHTPAHLTFIHTLQPCKVGKQLAWSESIVKTHSSREES